MERLIDAELFAQAGDDGVLTFAWPPWRCGRFPGSCSGGAKPSIVGKTGRASALHFRGRAVIENFVCRVPETASEMEQVIRYDRALFCKNSFSLEKYLAMHLQRPETCVAIFDRGGRLASYIIAYPLGEEYASRFTAGEIAEVDFTPEMIIGRGNSHLHFVLIISRLVVDPRFDPVSKSALLGSMLVWQTNHLRTIGARDFTIAMVTATPSGARLAMRMGARKLATDAQRKDDLDLFGGCMDLSMLERLVAGIIARLPIKLAQMDYRFLDTVLPTQPRLAPLAVGGTLSLVTKTPDPGAEYRASGRSHAGLQTVAP